MKNNKKTIKTILIIAILVICSIGFLFAPNDPDKIDLANRLVGPSSQFPFGTDTQGRCLFSRVLYGAETSLGVILISSVIIFIIGCPIGLLMGYQKKSLSWVQDGLLNTVTAMPPIAYLMVFIGAWGNSVFTTFMALTLAILPRLIKLVKTKTEIERDKAYVISAVVCGCKKYRLLFKHILPNCMKEIISYISLMCAEMIMTITSFSFIGLGLGDDVKDLGGIIQEAYDVVLLRPDILIYPVAFIFIISLTFNILGQEVK